MPGDYKTHANSPGNDPLTLCGLSKQQARGALPIARWPIGITCRNCLTLWYQPAISRTCS